MLNKCPTWPCLECDPYKLHLCPGKHPGNAATPAPLSLLQHLRQCEINPRPGCPAKRLPMRQKEMQIDEHTSSKPAVLVHHLPCSLAAEKVQVDQGELKLAAIYLAVMSFGGGNTRRCGHSQNILTLGQPSIGIGAIMGYPFIFAALECQASCNQSEPPTIRVGCLST